MSGVKYGLHLAGMRTAMMDVMKQEHGIMFCKDLFSHQTLSTENSVDKDMLISNPA